MYRKFTAESSITAVDVQMPDALPSDATKEQPAGSPNKAGEKKKP
jgi:hypothetical protein